MKTEFTETGTLRSQLSITIEKDDYKPAYDKELKKYSKQAQMKGFRKGKVPMSAIKKMYGRGILAEVIDKKVQEVIADQISDLDILGSPISAEDQEYFDFDLKDLQDYTFKFDIGRAPDIEVQGVTSTDAYDNFLVTVDDSMLDEGMLDLRKRMGKQEEVEAPIEEKDIIVADITEVAPEKEEPYTTQISIMPDRMSEEYKEDFIGKEIGYKGAIDIFKIEQDTTEDYVRKYFLKDAPEDVGSNFDIVIRSIKRLVPAEANEEFYTSAFGADVKEDSEARSKLRENLEAFYATQGTSITKRKILETLIDGHDVVLPDDFLKRWLKISNEKLTTEQIEEEYSDFTKNLKWTLIKERIAKDQEIKATPEAVKNHLVDNFKRQFAQYGYGAGMDLDFDSIGDRLMQDQKAVQRGYEEVLADLVFDHILSTVQLNDKNLSYEEYQEIVKDLQQNNG